MVRLGNVCRNSLTSALLTGVLPRSRTSRFLKPVYAGDTLYPLLEIIDLKAQRTTGVVTLKAAIRNQRDELVLEGEQKFLLRRRNPAA